MKEFFPTVKPLKNSDFERIEYCETLGDLSEAERMAYDYQNKMGGWGQRKKAKFKELMQEGFDFETAFVIVEEHKGVNPGYKK